ncbi:MAG TPA: hypothetical protein QF772_09045 [Nitrospinaceae bacterium]|jgi:hypothetical protein|nr:hypothetical protein [Nitrospinota bacterium]MBV51173.1 hypothetical protein [Nitrospinota bacterium]HAX47230.1 hypothetical protein [Nitrospina sp.]HJO58350.1 hypothetical protein [Nitrospinaceae bacterium]|tara:strand:- start:987 stop:1472 length:486 start_codon:yes stop_codon:yes gene_type:complete
MEKELEPKGEFRDEKKENLSRRISFWFSLVVSIALTCWYYSSNPPDTTEMMKMRSFFKENIMDVAKFIRLPYGEMEQFAESKTHPFYKTYFKASGVEKDKIKALIHISRDYNPNQYWFNMMFLWVIAFTSLWFLGLMLEAVMILVRRDDAERKWRRKQNVE